MLRTYNSLENATLYFFRQCLTENTGFDTESINLSGLEKTDVSNYFFKRINLRSMILTKCKTFEGLITDSLTSCHFCASPNTKLF